MRSHSGVIAASFTPALLPGLQIDFDPSTFGLANGANVTSLVDSSGNARHASTLTGTTPTYVLSDPNFGGYPVVVFAVNGSLRTGAIAGMSGGATFFLVYSQTHTAGSEVSEVLFDGSDGDMFAAAQSATMERAYAGDSIYNRQAFFPLAPNVRSVTFNGASSGIWQDGVQVASGNAGSVQFSSLDVGSLGETSR